LNTFEYSVKIPEPLAKEKVAGSIPVSRFPHIYKKNEGFRTLVFLLFGNEFGNVF